MWEKVGLRKIQKEILEGRNRGAARWSRSAVTGELKTLPVPARFSFLWMILSRFFFSCWVCLVCVVCVAYLVLAGWLQAGLQAEQI